MDQVDWHLTSEALVFIGVVLQAAAVFWIWLDWTMSQFRHEDWRKKHRDEEVQTIKRIATLWKKFGGQASVPVIDWSSSSADELEKIGNEFPAWSDDEALGKRKVEALTPRYGIGPSDGDLKQLGRLVSHLAILRRGVANYRTFVRKKTFGSALVLMLLGFALQLIGSWPSRWWEAHQRQSVSAGHVVRNM